MRLTALLFLFASCGGSSGTAQQGPQAPEGEPDQESGDPLQVRGLRGTYGRDVVQSVEAESSPAMLDCYTRAANEHAYAFGRVVIALKVGPDGNVRNAYLRESDLGHRGAERCIVEEALRIRFPRPQGNAEADVTFRYEFSPAGRPADVADPEGLVEALEVSRDVLRDCTGGHRGFTLTLYVDRRGAVASAGASMPDADAGEAADCLAETAKGWTIPIETTWYSKMSVSL